MQQQQNYQQEPQSIEPAITDASVQNSQPDVIQELYGREIYKSWIIQITFMSMISYLFYILLSLSQMQEYQLNILFSIIPFMLYHIFEIIKNQKAYLKYTFDEFLDQQGNQYPNYSGRSEQIEQFQVQKNIKKLDLIESCLFILLGTLIIICSLTSSKMWLSCLPLPLACAVRYIIYCKQREESECMSLIDFLIITFRVFFMIQAFTVALQLDGIIHWTWKEVFWGYWVFFSVVVGIIFGLLLMTISKICQYVVKEIQFYELQGIIWIFFIVTNQSVSSFMCVMGLIRKYEDDEQYYLLYSFYLNIGFTGFYALYTLLGYNSIIKFMKMVITEDADDLQSNQQLLRVNNNGVRRKQKKKLIVKQFQKSNILHDLPKYLLKQSGTYFKKMNPEFSYREYTSNKNESSQKKLIISGSKNPDVSDFQIVQNTTNPTINSSINIDKNIYLDKLDDQIESYSPSKINRIVTGKNKKNDKIDIVDDATSPKSPESPSYVQSQNISHRQVTQRQQMAQSERQNIKKGKRQASNLHKMKENFFIKKTNQLNTYRRENQEDAQQPANNLPNQEQECVICFGENPDCVFFECGHGGICYECSIDVWKKTGECYLCREPIEVLAQIDLKSSYGNHVKVICGYKYISLLNLKYLYILFIQFHISSTKMTIEQKEQSNE